MPDKTVIVRYTGPVRRVSIGGVWLQPDETYELPSSTVDRYPGFFADLSTAPVGSGGPGDSILDRAPPINPRGKRPAEKTKTPEKPTKKKRTSKAKRSSGRKS